MTEPEDVTKEPLLSDAFRARLERIDLVARKILAGELRGEVQTRHSGSGSLFRDHARYTPGDDLRFVDWNVYSRLGELRVKKFDAEESLDLALVLDATASMDFGHANKFAAAQRVVAALAFVALNRLGTVRIATVSESSVAVSRRYFGRHDTARFLQDLARHRARGRGALTPVARRLVKRRRGRGVALIVSDFFDESGYDEALTTLQKAGYRVGAIQVIDRLDLRPLATGYSKLVDVETAAAIKGVVSSRLVAAYEREARAWCDRLEAFCRRRGMDHARVDSAWPLERVMTELLRRRGFLE